MLEDAPPAPLTGMDESARFPTEADLVAACRAGRREAFDELVRRHYGRIHRLAWAMAGPEGASDLAQETFLAAVRAFPSFRGDAQVGTWLVSILRNQYTMWLRGRKRWKLSALEGEGERLPAPPSSAIEAGVRGILERVKDLPEELRMTLLLFYVDGLKYAEIAEAMECPIGTVRSRLFEARERLKALVEKNDDVR
jgi:RNA polymerase sigma-70 factor, ECF subfamily